MESKLRYQTDSPVQTYEMQYEGHNPFSKDVFFLFGTRRAKIRNPFIYAKKRGFIGAGMSVQKSGFHTFLFAFS